MQQRHPDFYSDVEATEPCLPHEVHEGHSVEVEAATARSPKREARPMPSEAQSLENCLPPTDTRETTEARSQEPAARSPEPVQFTAKQ